MGDDFELAGEANGVPKHGDPDDVQDPLEALTLIVAHLAAQLTITQIRLRALATALEAQDGVDPAVVQGHAVRIADREAGFYLRENLGETLASLIEVDDLAREIVEFMSRPE